MDLVRLDTPLPQGSGAVSRYCADIVAVHGLKGHYEKSWIDQATGTLWLRDLLPLDMPGCRVFSFNYDARIFTNSVMTISDYAVRLLGAVSRERSTETERSRPLFFICHSLGGLVAKKALVLANQEAAHRNTLQMTQGIAFFGTPHLGSAVADRAGPVANIFKAFSGDIRNDHLKTLGAKEISAELLSINQAFRFLTADLVLVSLYETRPMPPMNSIVVSKESALMNLPNEVQVPRDTDHRSLSKFASREEGCYGELISAMKQLFQPTLVEPAAQLLEELSPRAAKCLQTLYISDYHNHKAAIERPVGGTCHWIVGHPAYLSWMRNPNNMVLWISGGAGCGKSVLSSFMIDALRQDIWHQQSRFTVCYHFFNDRDSNQRPAHFALCGILHQLIAANPTLISHVLDAYQKKGSQITRDLRTLWDILVELMLDPAAGKATFVFDALDECSEDGRQRLLDWIVELAEDSSFPKGRVKILLTSRPEFSIQTKLRAPSIKAIRMEDEMNELQSDIKKVIMTKLEVIGYAKGLTAFVFQQLMHNADGTFLWVALVLRLLEESGDSSHRGVVSVLEGSARGQNLFSVYSEILNRIPAHRQKEARKVLQIAATAPRPLTMDEFNIAFAIDPDDPADGSCDLKSRLQQDLPRYLLRLCGPFIRMVDGSVHLVHQTAKEFLLSGSPGGGSAAWAFDLEGCDLLMARICIWYLLNHRAMSLSDEPSNEWLDGPEHRDGLLAYASTYWPTHFRDSQGYVDARIVQNALQLHRQSGSGLPQWFDHYWPAIGFQGDVVPRVDALTSASIAGHEAVINLILRAPGPKHVALDPDGRSALLWACRCGHRSTAELLLNTGRFDANASDVEDCTALWWATLGGYAEVASLLLETAGIGVNAADKDGRTPLHLACWLGYESIVKLLLSHPEIKTDVKDSTGWTPLTWASWRGRGKIVSYFIQRDDIATTALSQDNYRRTPLARACEKGHTNVVMQLLPLSDPVVLDKENRTPLSLAAQAGNATLVRLLLEDPRVAAEADEPDEAGRTPLLCAATEGRAEVVQVFISPRFNRPGSRKLVDVDSPLFDEQTPLSVAAENGQLKVVQLLIQAGAAPSSRDCQGKTPLWWAASCGQTEVVRFLLGAGAEPNCADGEGQHTPLLVAAEEGHRDVVRELVRAGRAVQVNAKDNHGKTALWIAARAGREDVAQVLLERAEEFSVTDLMDAVNATASERTHLTELIKGAGRRASDTATGSGGPGPGPGPPPGPPGPGPRRASQEPAQGKWMRRLSRRHT